jgi:2-phosphosulfolactate phosphatase
MAAVALANGATKIIIVCDVEEALPLRAAGASGISAWETFGGRAPPDFDFGNSPFEASQADLKVGLSFSAPAPAHKASSPPSTR